MTKKLLFAVILLFVGFAYAQAYKPFTSQQLKTIIPSDSRTVVSLAGSWERSYDGEWEAATLPLSEPENKKVSYKKTIRIEKGMAESHTWHLYFLGLNHQAEIYFNDQFVGRYVAGLSPIMIRIPDKMINIGNNVLLVQINTAEAATGQIIRQSITAKKTYTGIIREAFLVGTPAVWVSDIKFNTKLSGDYSNGNIKAKVSISSGKLAGLSKLLSKDSTSNNIPVIQRADVLVELQLVRKGTNEVIASAEPKRIVFEAERTVVSDFEINVANPNLWSPENPNLYDIKAKITHQGITIDDMSAQIGFKDLKISNIAGKTIALLNGKPIELKGVSYVEDHQVSLQSLSAFRMEEDVLMMKTLGANLVRFTYNPPHPYFSYLCDKYGLMMMIDLPLYNVPSSILKLDEIKVLMKNYTKQLVNTFNNSVALIAYGISDGLKENDISLDFNNEIVNLFRSISNKMLYKNVPIGSHIIHTDGYDFIGISSRKEFRSKEHLKEDIIQMKNLLGNVPFMMSFGVAVQPYNHNGYSDPLSIEHQAFYIKNHVMVSRETGALGTVVSNFNDFELDNPYLVTNIDNLYLSTSGLTDRYRNQRLAFRTLQALFNDEKEPLLNAGSYTEQAPVSFIAIGIILGVVFFFLLNRFRRFREYLFRSILRPFNFYSDIRDQRIISSFQTILLGLLISFTVGIFMSSVNYFYRSSETAQYFFMLLAPSSSFQEVLFDMIWMPELMMLIITVLSFLVVFVVSIIIRIFAFFVRARVYLTDALTITIWGGIPYLVLLPLSIVLVRLLVMVPELVTFFIILYLGLNVWVIARILRSTAVVFDKPAMNVYIIGTIFLVLMVGIPIGIYQIKYSIFAYFQYFTEVMINI